MSSTDADCPRGQAPEHDDAGALIRDLFDSHLVPAAERLRKAGESAFPVGADASRDSYYTIRGQTTMMPVDFEASAPGSLDDLAPALARLWDQQGAPELAALGPGLTRLARALYLAEEPSDELSPFVYVMF